MKEENINNQNVIRIPIKKIKNPGLISTIILLIICLILLYIIIKPAKTNQFLSGEQAGQKLVNYLNSRTEEKIEYVSYNDLGSIYEITVNLQGDNIPIYITKDGNYFIQGAVPIS